MFLDVVGGPVEATARRLKRQGRALRFYGFTVGWLGFGIVRSRPTEHASLEDGAPVPPWPAKVGKWRPVVRVARTVDEESRGILRDVDGVSAWTEKYVRDAEVFLARLGERYPFEYYAIEGVDGPLLVQSLEWPRHAALVAPRRRPDDDVDRVSVGMTDAWIPPGRLKVLDAAHVLGITEANPGVYVRDPKAEEAIAETVADSQLVPEAA